MGNVEGWSESQQMDQEDQGSVLVVRDYLGATSISGPAPNETDPTMGMAGRHTFQGQGGG